VCEGDETTLRRRRRRRAVCHVPSSDWNGGGFSTPVMRGRAEPPYPFNHNLLDFLHEA
jgi:hypothetical protein